MTISLIYPSLNSEQWHEPAEFIPERFDPESEYFYKPSGKNEVRHPKAYHPFSYGLRNCPGQTLAKLQFKVLLTRIITKCEYELDKEVMDAAISRFSQFDNFKLSGMITKLKDMGH